MKKLLGLSLGALYLTTVSCLAQQGTADMPDAPKPQVTTQASLTYRPPTQGERFRYYAKHTYGIASVIEAGVRGGIDQGLDRPSQWPEGASGYADRFGSAMGEIAVRGTTEYVFSDLFREDLRRTPCDSSCTESALTRAFEDTFTARKGPDGHRAFSVARFLGPIAAGVVERETWYPGGYSDKNIVGEVGVNYGFTFVRSYLRELIH
ncbi:MAG TPA: hypothetical protein VME23_14205 [Terracidiphilus sp.]|nr:hypothetical protein [Terracidiphilus sp.]